MSSWLWNGAFTSASIVFWCPFWLGCIKLAQCCLLASILLQHSAANAQGMLPVRFCGWQDLARSAFFASVAIPLRTEYVCCLIDIAISFVIVMLAKLFPLAILCFPNASRVQILVFIDCNALARRLQGCRWRQRDSNDVRTCSSNCLLVGFKLQKPCTSEWQRKF